MQQWITKFLLFHTPFETKFVPFHAHFETKFFPLTPQTTVYVHWNEKWSPPQQQQEEQQQRFPLPDLSSATQIKIGLRFFAAIVVGGGEEAPLSVPKGGFTFLKKMFQLHPFCGNILVTFFHPSRPTPPSRTSSAPASCCPACCWPQRSRWKSSYCCCHQEEEMEIFLSFLPFWGALISVEHGIRWKKVKGILWWVFSKNNYF